MRIDYQYPIVYLEDDDPEDALILHEKGSIHLIRLDREPYECTVDARGSSFHLLFGSQINGNFLCVPNRHAGCELSGLGNQDWNLHSLLETECFDYEESTAIITALALINKMIIQQ